MLQTSRFYIQLPSTSNSVKIEINGPSDFLGLESDNNNSYSFKDLTTKLSPMAVEIQLLRFNLSGTGNGGWVGIGTNSTGDGQLVVNQPNAGGDIFSASQSGNTKFVINNQGNVGIGTTSPLATRLM